MVKMQEDIARALYEDWKSSDLEIKDTWENAFPPLRRIFLRRAEIALEVIFPPEQI